jgi:dynein heavy chain 1
LADLVAKLFCQESLNNSYPLIKDDGSSLLIPMPQDTTKNKYVEWVKQLPPNEKPTWLGLPDNAEKVLLISEGNRKQGVSNHLFYVTSYLRYQICG